MRTLISETEVLAGVARLAADITTAHGRKPLTVIAVMTGSIVLLADLIRLLEMPLRVGVIQASSYKGDVRPGLLSINAEMMPDIAGRDVLLVDDIFDTGATLTETVRRMEELGPTSIRTAVLLHKLGKATSDRRPDFVAFKIPDEFVVGYGLDYRDEYRNLRHIAVLEADDLAPPSSPGTNRGLEPLA